MMSLNGIDQVWKPSDCASYTTLRNRTVRNWRRVWHTAPDGLEATTKRLPQQLRFPNPSNSQNQLTHLKPGWIGFGKDGRPSAQGFPNDYREHLGGVSDWLWACSTIAVTYTHPRFYNLHNLLHPSYMSAFETYSLISSRS